MELFKPAWMSKTEKKALKAAEKVSDQIKLGIMAKKAPCSSVRVTAIEKLADLNTLVEVAENDADFNVRLKAFRKLPEQMRTQKMRMDIAINGNGNKEQKEIIAQLTDQEFLTKLTAKKAAAELANKRLSELALLEVEQTDDQKVLAAIARNENHKARIEAILKLTDRTVLEEIAIGDKNGHAGEKAIKEIYDQSMLYRIAVNAANESVAKKAVEKVKDKQALYDIACGSSDKKIVRIALSSLQEAQDLLYQFICSYNDNKLCVFAVEKLKDEEKLYEIACSGYAYPLREQALLQLNDQNKIHGILQSVTDSRLKSIACGKTREGHNISGCICKRCGAIVTQAKHDWKCTRHQSYDGSGEADYICKKCGLEKHENWNPYNASERYSHASRFFV